MSNLWYNGRGDFRLGLGFGAATTKVVDVFEKPKNQYSVPLKTFEPVLVTLLRTIDGMRKGNQARVCLMPNGAVHLLKGINTGHPSGYCIMSNPIEGTDFKF